MGPVANKYLSWNSLWGGNWPSLGTISRHNEGHICVQSMKTTGSSHLLGVVLCPKMPFMNEGNRILPPISAPMAKGTPAADTIQPAPPELPPTIRVKSYGLFVVPYREFRLEEQKEPCESHVVCPRSLTIRTTCILRWHWCCREVWLLLWPCSEQVLQSE